MLDELARNCITRASPFQILGSTHHNYVHLLRGVGVDRRILQFQCTEADIKGTQHFKRKVFSLTPFICQAYLGHTYTYVRHISVMFQSFICPAYLSHTQYVRHVSVLYMTGVYFGHGYISVEDHESSAILWTMMNLRGWHGDGEGGVFAANLKITVLSKKCTRRQFWSNAHFLLLSAGFCASGLDMPAGLICSSFYRWVVGDG